MVSGGRPGPCKSSAHRGGKLMYATRKQRAIFSAQRPSLSSLKTKHPNRFRYLEKTYGRKNGSASNYSRTRRGWDHYDGREGRGERGQLQGRSEWRVQRRRSSRSMSPNARDRYDAVGHDVTYFDYDKQRGEGSDFQSYGPAKLRYSGKEAEAFEDEQEDEWEDELQVLDALDGSNGAHRTGKAKKAELEYLKRMLTRLRNRHKELFSHRSREKLPSERGLVCYNRNSNNYDRKPPAPPPSYRSYTRSRSQDSYIRRGRSPRRYYNSLERTQTRESHYYGSGKSQRTYSCTHRESKISQVAPISNQLKAAVGTRTYPVRTFGRSLHVRRWLSDRYAKQTTFNFGELPRSEGIKEYYILDPNDPNKYINVPRPGQPAPGARGDYYRGAAWNAYQQEKQEWLETQGCHYPDAWISADASEETKDGDTSMAGSESRDTTSVDTSMSDTESDTTVRGPQGARRNSFTNRQETPAEMGTASETSEDLISLDADGDNGVLLPVLLDPRIADISSMIQQTTILDHQASAIPTVATASMSVLSELMPLAEATQVPIAVGQPDPLLIPAANTAADGINIQEILQGANPGTTVSHAHPLAPESLVVIRNIEQQTASLPAIAPMTLSKTTTVATASAPEAHQSAESTTIPGLSLLTTNAITLDEDWNKEWEEEWRYRF